VVITCFKYLKLLNHSNVFSSKSVERRKWVSRFAKFSSSAVNVKAELKWPVF
jgi:hypothetical protein